MDLSILNTSPQTPYKSVWRPGNAQAVSHLNPLLGEEGGFSRRHTRRNGKRSHDSIYAASAMPSRTNALQVEDSLKAEDTESKPSLLS